MYNYRQRERDSNPPEGRNMMHHYVGTDISFSIKPGVFVVAIAPGEERDQCHARPHHGAGVMESWSCFHGGSP